MLWVWCRAGAWSVLVVARSWCALWPQASSVTSDTACSSGLKSWEPGTNLQCGADAPCAVRSCILLCTGHPWPYGCSTAVQPWSSQASCAQSLLLQGSSCTGMRGKASVCLLQARLVSILVTEEALGAEALCCLGAVGQTGPLWDGTAPCCHHCHCTLWGKAGLLCHSHREPSRAAVFPSLLSLPDLHKRQVKGLAWAVQSQQVQPLHCLSCVKPVDLCPLGQSSVRLVGRQTLLCSL